jgi:hypothetical protein
MKQTYLYPWYPLFQTHMYVYDIVQDPLLEHYLTSSDPMLQQ